MSLQRVPVTCQWCKCVMHRRYVLIKRLGFSIVPAHTDRRTGKECRGSGYPSMEHYRTKTVEVKA